MKINWKYVVITLIAIVMTFHFTAIWYISSQKYQLTDTQYYEQEKHIDADMKALRLGRILQWNVSVEGRNRVVVAVTGVDGKPSQLQEVRAALYRPNNAASDIVLALGEQSPGQYTAETNALAEGRWDVRVEGKQGEETVAFEQRMSVE